MINYKEYNVFCIQAVQVTIDTSGVSETAPNLTSTSANQMTLNVAFLESAGTGQDCYAELDDDSTVGSVDVSATVLK